MASSSGNSNNTTTTTTTQLLRNSSSEEDLQHVMDERKRKRMQSNRESARRSRMRKQKHLDDLMAQVADLRRDNGQILNNINLTTQHYLNVEAQNSVLRAQMSELNNRLHSLNEILNYMNSSPATAALSGGEVAPPPGMEMLASDGFMGSHWNLGYFNHPIMASVDYQDFGY